MLAEYLGLFFAALVAATLLPAASEVALVALSLADGAQVFWLWAVATAGNTLGAAINWALGRYLRRFTGRRWFPFKPSQIDAASERFRRYGLWSLLFAWLPIVGDPLTFVAGVLDVRPAPFVILVAVGKGARYAALLWVALAFSA